MTEQFNEEVPTDIALEKISVWPCRRYIEFGDFVLTVPEARELRAWLDTVIPKGSTGDGGVKHD